MAQSHSDDLFGKAIRKPSSPSQSLLPPRRRPEPGSARARASAERVCREPRGMGATMLEALRS
eukprot:1589445-Alexandrium_andersonii.AAC.1